VGRSLLVCLFSLLLSFVFLPAMMRKKEQFSLNISRHTHTAKVVREPRKKKERNKTFATFALHFSAPVPRMPE
jgi:hypothetical protein